jgi:hypothetical protein
MQAIRGGCLGTLHDVCTGMTPLPSNGIPRTAKDKMGVKERRGVSEDVNRTKWLLDVYVLARL